MEKFDIKNHLFLLCKVECSCVPEFLARQEPPPPSRRQLFPVELVQLAAACCTTSTCCLLLDRPADFLAELLLVLELPQVVAPLPGDVEQH